MIRFKGKIFYMLLGILIFTTITVIGDTIINSNSVEYDNSGGSTDETTVEGAIEELYSMVGNLSSGSTGPTLCYDSECNQSAIMSAATSSDILALPTPTKDGYVFIGWYDAATGGNKLTSSTTISENTTVYAHWGQITSFAADSWKTIVAALKANRTAYEVGSTKTVTMNLEGKDKDYVLRLANTSTPDVCSTSGYSQTACGVVIEFVTTIGTRYMNSSATNAGGWASTAMRSYLTTYYSKLPNDLKSIIITTEPIVSGSGKNLSSPNTTGDKLYLLSTREIGYESSSDGKNNTSTDTRTLDYYSDCATTGVCDKRIKYTTSAGTTATEWWLRSANYGRTDSFLFVYSSGSSDWNAASAYAGVAPAFRILK